jgi:hypothetical protein
VADIKAGKVPNRDELEAAAEEVCVDLKDFEFGESNDAHEFFIAMLDCCNNMQLLLTFEVACLVQCDGCHKTSTTSDPCQSLEISLKRNTPRSTLQQLFQREYISKETFEYDQLALLLSHRFFAGDRVLQVVAATSAGAATKCSPGLRCSSFTSSAVV